MRVLFTGGSGMVGRNFLEHPEAGAFDILSPSSSELNLLDYQSVSEYLCRHKPDMVIHAAGKVGGIQANMREPVRFLLDNLDMGRNIVLAARQAGVKRLINLGSSCMYPRNAPNPLDEDSILKGELEPTNEGYALAKITVTRLCQYITREDPDYRYKTIIPCNLYGRWDKFAPEHSHLLAAIIQKIHQAKDSGREVGIWGNGTARREFLYAGDLADCMVRAVRDFETIPPLMNVGFGTDYSINEYYKTVADVLGYRGRFTHDLSKPVGMRQKTVSTAKQLTWGWKAGTGLADGLAETYKFYLEHIKPQDRKREKEST